MTSFHEGLPQMQDDFFLTDGGLETTLIFNEGIILPDFAAFVLLDRRGGSLVLSEYYHGYARIAERFNAGFILETPTWRANRDWGERLGYDRWNLDRINRRSVDLLRTVRGELSIPDGRVVLSGAIGPRGDGYDATRRMTAREASSYHKVQVRSLVAAGVDMISAFTINYAEEAIGIAAAAMEVGIPVTISFTLEIDGRLPTGQTLRSAIEAVDMVTSGYAAYFQINCAHPSHFAGVLEDGADWTGRIRGVRANASCRSHSELDASLELDAGDPTELGVQYAELKGRFPQLTVLGGCCGTDLRHVERIAEACAPHFAGIA